MFTPKSLLRHPRCVSSIEDFTKNGFAEVMDDVTADPKNVTRIAFCTGKVYYDLLDRKEKDKNTDLAIIRLEQLYPFPKKQVEAILNKYAQATSYLWVQEEPENSGAWSYILRVMRQHNLRYIGREESASPATGSHKQHDKEQKAILDEVFSSQLVPSN